MPIGVLNPGDVGRTTDTRPAAVLSSVNQRRWYSDELNTEVRDQDLNSILGQLRYAYDYFAVPDVEGDESMLQKAIVAGATALSGNLAAFQGLAGNADRVPFWTSPSIMSTFTATAYSRALLAKTSLLQWQDALGISAASSPNVVALGNLAGGADQLPYFTGSGTMSQTPFSSAARSLLDDTTTTAMRTTLGLGTMATQSTTGYAATATSNVFAASNQFTADVTMTARLYVYPTTNHAYSSLLANSGKEAMFLWGGNISGAGYAGTRWAMGKDSTAEAASDTGYTGSNFALWAMGGPNNAAEVVLGKVFDVVRSTQILTFTQSPLAPTPTYPDNSTKLATTAYVVAATAGITAGMQPSDPQLTALAALAGGVDVMPYFTSTTAMAQTTLTAYARTLLDDADAATARTTLGVPLGTSGATVPLLSTANTWTTTQTFTGQIVANGAAQFNHSSGISITAGQVYVNRTGDAVDGSMGIVSDAGKNSFMSFGTIGYWRWLIGKNTDAGDLGGTGAGAAGSNFYIEAWKDDNSGAVGVALTINRATLITNFNVSPTAPTPAAEDNSTKLATTAYVQNELLTLQPYDATLNAMAGVGTAADTMLYFSGVDTALSTPITSVARTLLDDTTTTIMRTTLGLGTVATLNTGTSGANAVPVLSNASNTWSGTHIMTAASVAYTPVTMISTDPLNTWGPIMALRRTSASAAASDDLGQILFDGNNASAANVSYADIYASIVDPTAASVDGRLTIRTAINNVLTPMLTMNLGLLVGAAAGGDKGVGTLNATALYEGGVALSAIYATIASLGTGAFATIASYAPLASPALSGTPTAPTATPGTSTLQIASTAFVAAAVAAGGGGGGQPLDATLTALSGLTTAVDTMPYFTGVDASTTTPLTLIARQLLDDTTNTAMRTTLGLGTSATVATGTSGATIPLLNGINTWSNTNTFTITTASSACINAYSTDAGATVAPILVVGRYSASTAANDQLASINFKGYGVDNSTVSTYADMFATIIDPTVASIDGSFVIRTAVGGTLIPMLTMTQGILVGNTAGGDKGTNTLNAATLYENDVSLALKYAGLVSPTFTGIPAAPTAGVGTSTTQLATTAFVAAAISAVGGVSLSSANTWTAAQTMSLATAAATPLVIESTEAGAALGPIVDIYRNSATAADSDLIGGITFSGNSDTLVKRTYASIEATAVDTGNASEDGNLLLRASLGGSLQTLATLGGSTNGIVTYTFTGGTGSGLTFRLMPATGIPTFHMIAAASGNTRTIQGLTGAGGLRWLVHVGDGTAEGGSDAGSNFKFSAYTDAAALIGDALTIYRKTTALVLNGATGGDKGTGTLNAVGLYEQGVALSAKYEPLGKLVAVDVKTASYTLVLADAGKLIELNVASANTLTVPPNSTVAFPVGTRIDLAQYGAGQTTITPGAGVTIRSSGTKLKLTNIYAVASLYKRATDEWVAMGDLAA